MWNTIEYATKVKLQTNIFYLHKILVCDYLSEHWSIWLPFQIEILCHLKKKNYLLDILKICWTIFTKGISSDISSKKNVISLIQVHKEEGKNPVGVVSRSLFFGWKSFPLPSYCFFFSGTALIYALFLSVERQMSFVDILTHPVREGNVTRWTRVIVRLILPQMTGPGGHLLRSV